MSCYSIEINIDSPPFVIRNRNLSHEMAEIQVGISDSDRYLIGKEYHSDAKEISDILQNFLFKSIDLNDFPITDFIDVRSVEFEHQLFSLTSQFSRKFCLSGRFVYNIWEVLRKSSMAIPSHVNNYLLKDLDFGFTRSQFKFVNTNFLINDVTLQQWDNNYILFNDGIEYNLQNSSIFRSEESLFHSGSGKIFRAKFKVNVINPILIGIIDMNGMALKDPRYIEWNRTDKISKLDL